MAKQLNSTTFTALASALLLIVGLALGDTFTPTARADQSRPDAQVVTAQYQTQHRTIEVDGLKIFYREAGPGNAPTILLLHGFPTLSHMFRNLIPALSDRYHVVAPDYPGFGNSAMPSVDKFDYTFEHLAEVMQRFVDKLNLKRYSLYVMDYGARWIPSGGAASGAGGIPDRAKW